MQGFIGRRIPLFVRRGLTMLPALVVLELGLPPTGSLVVCISSCNFARSVK